MLLQFTFQNYELGIINTNQYIYRLIAKQKNILFYACPIASKKFANEIIEIYGHFKKHPITTIEHLVIPWLREITPPLTNHGQISILLLLIIQVVDFNFLTFIAYSNDNVYFSMLELKAIQKKLN